MKYYLRVALGMGKSEWQEVSKDEWEYARGVVQQSEDFSCLSHFPDAFVDGGICERYIAHFHDGFSEWKTEFGFTVGGERTPSKEDVMSFMDLDDALTHMFDDGIDDVIEVGFDDFDDDDET